jgi:hypothetical protein
MSKKGRYTPNDQRSNAKNPNNPAYQHAETNRAAQLEKNAPPQKKSEKIDSDKKK